MSQIFDELQDYGQRYTKISGSEEMLSEDQVKRVKEVNVQYSKDNEGKVLNKLCMAFVLDNGATRFKGLDNQSKLKIGDKVKPESVKFFKLTNGSKTISRCDGEAL